MGYSNTLSASKHHEVRVADVAQKENSSWISGGGPETQSERGSALNDVKNRLLIMQKNKEELEEKLRNYEAKIRQHFSRA